MAHPTTTITTASVPSLIAYSSTSKNLMRCVGEIPLTPTKMQGVGPPYPETQLAVQAQIRQHPSPQDRRPVEPHTHLHTSTHTTPQIRQHTTPQGSGA